MHGALTIAGSDPTGGAGLQADLQVFRAFGVHGAAVVTALTIQDTVKVHRVMPVFPTVVLDQIRVLIADVRPRAVKLGMLASDDVVRNVALALESLPEEVPIVIDPVLASSDGTPLLERRAVPALIELFGRAALVTPNLIEAEQLTGLDVSSRRGSEEAAAKMISDMGAGAVLLKGGHRSGRPDDLLMTAHTGGPEATWLEGERIDVAPPRGTGCALSAAIAASLAAGRSLEQAVLDGRAFVAEALRRAHPIGAGAPRLGWPEGSP